MKNGTRILSALVVLTMVLSLFGAVAVAEDKPTLKVALTTSSFVTDYEDNYFTNYLEEKLGIEIEFYMLPVDSADTRTKIALMATGGEDMPDVFVVDNHLTSEMLLTYGQSGFFMELDEYINDPEKMPNYNAIPDEDRAIMTTASTQADGHIYSLSAYEPETWNYTPFRMYINRDWLDAVGKEVPTTTAELKDVLIAFRDGDPNGNGLKDEIGVYGQASGGYGENIVAALINSFIYWNNNQLNYGLALDESDYETVYAPYTTEAWRNAMRYLKELHDEGLLSASTFTDDNATFKAVLNQETPVVGLTSAGSLSNWPAAVSNANFLQMELIAPLTGPDGVNYTPFIEQWPGQELMISGYTDKVDLALKFADEFFTYETSVIERFGIEGEDWSRDPELLKGQTNAYVEAGMTDAVKLLVTSTMWADNQNHTWRNHGPRYMSLANFLTVFDYSAGKVYDPEDPTQLNGKCYEMYWDKKPAKLMPQLKYTVEDTEMLMDAMTTIPDFVKQAIAEFTTGTRDIETGWEQYLAELDSMGLQELISVSQATYDRIK